MRYLLWAIAAVLCLLGGVACGGDSGSSHIHPPLPAPVYTIMALGDSLTAGCYTNTGGYRQHLQALLTAHACRYNFVGRSIESSCELADPEHEGYPGATIRQIGEHAQTAMAQFHPDIVLLLAGTNDVRTNGDSDQPTSPDYWATAPERLDNLLTQLVREDPVVVVVGTLPLLCGDWCADEPRVEEFNAQVRAIVQQRQRQGEPVVLADLHSAVPACEMDGGLHPTPAGYDRMAEVWFAALAPIFSR